VLRVADPEDVTPLLVQDRPSAPSALSRSESPEPRWCVSCARVLETNPQELIALPLFARQQTLKTFVDHCSMRAQG